MKIRNFLIINLAAYLILLAFITSSLAQIQPPKAEVRNVTDEYFGQKIVDPYGWMEDLKAEETQKWIKAQADYADAYLKKLPMRDEILERLNGFSNASVNVGGINPRGDSFIYTKRNPGEQSFKLYVRKGLSGAERLLVDPEKLSSAGKRYALGGWGVSWDGKYVSYVVFVGGAETGEIRIVETATGKDMGERIDRARFSAGDWMPDGKSFLYNRLQQLPENAPQTEKYQKIRVYLHRLGTNPNRDKPVFGFDVNPGITFDQTLLTFVTTSPNWKYAVAYVNSGVSPNNEVYVAPIEALNQSTVPWRKIISFDDKVSSWNLHGDYLYLKTYKDTPRSKIIRTSIKQPDLSKAETFFSGGEAIVLYGLAQRDAFYVQTLEDGIAKIWHVDYKTKKAELIKLPYQGSAYISTTEANMDGIYFGINSWTKSYTHFKYDPKTGNSIDTKLVPPLPIDMSEMEFVNAKAKSHDGTLVPLVIIYKKGLKLDGTNPVLMDGYGAYGFENTSPFFFTNALPWLERGGVIVRTGVRGGGEYGEEWHLAGKGKTKPNTWKDFIACAEYLISKGYTSPKHLGIVGGSAGGVLISNAIAERPDLFGAAIIRVGLNNALRGETTANGVPNIPEFGSFKTEEGFKALLAMDGYHKIRDGVKYPAVLLTHGINDTRVEPWMSAKMAARLQAATASGKPVLLRVDYDTGHGGGSTQKQRNERTADEYAFLFQQLGISR